MLRAAALRVYLHDGRVAGPAAECYGPWGDHVPERRAGAGLARFRGVHGVAAGAGQQMARSLLPGWARGGLRRAAVWSDRLRPAPSVEDWSRPLIPARSGPGEPRDVPASKGDVLTGKIATAQDPDVVAAAWSRDSAVPAAELRCLIVTSRLDVGGVEEVVAFLAAGCLLAGSRPRSCISRLTRLPTASRPAAWPGCSSPAVPRSTRPGRAARQTGSAGGIPA